MELSLERYRHAALPSKYTDGAEDQRLRPRISPHMFPGSLILSQDKSHYQRILNAWYGHPKQTWRLIYRASSHGFSASAFHRHCDGVAPTYVVVMVVQRLKFREFFCLRSMYCRGFVEKCVEGSVMRLGGGRLVKVTTSHQSEHFCSHCTTTRICHPHNFT